MKRLLLATVAAGALGAGALAASTQPMSTDGAVAGDRSSLFGQEGGAGGEGSRSLSFGEDTFLVADHRHRRIYGHGYGGEGAEGGEGGEGHHKVHSGDVVFPVPDVRLPDFATLCASKQTVGTIAGAAAGAILGAQVGSGSGRLAATAAGTLLGAVLGNGIGGSLDRIDQTCARQAEEQAHSAPLGQTIAWKNPESGHAGTVTPVRDGIDGRSGRYCREYQTTVTIGGTTQQAFGTACRRSDGSWEII